VLRALALAASGDQAAAAGALAGALTLACPQGYVRVVADEGAPMGVLLGRLARVLQALSQNHAAPGARRETAAVPGLVEQLTAREVEILRLLAAGTPNSASPTGSWSPSTPSKNTSPTSWPSSARPTAPRPSPARGNSA
jgi:LuxR family transcriptional regulator, maltose regulon positive regulatory protein